MFCFYNFNFFSLCSFYLFARFNLYIVSKNRITMLLFQAFQIHNLFEFLFFTFLRWVFLNDELLDIANKSTFTSVSRWLTLFFLLRDGVISASWKFQNKIIKIIFWKRVYLIFYVKFLIVFCESLENVMILHITDYYILFSIFECLD